MFLPFEPWAFSSYLCLPPNIQIKLSAIEIIYFINPQSPPHYCTPSPAYQGSSESRCTSSWEGVSTCWHIFCQPSYRYPRWGWRREKERSQFALQSDWPGLEGSGGGGRLSDWLGWCVEMVWDKNKTPPTTYTSHLSSLYCKYHPKLSPVSQLSPAI